MSFNHEEQAIWNEFQHRDLMDYDNAMLFLAFASNVLGRDYKANRKVIFHKTRWMQSECQKRIMSVDTDTGQMLFDIYQEALKLEARYIVDSFFLYIEIDEVDPNKRFYLPRRKRLKPITDAYQQIYDGELDFLSVSQPKRTGKELSVDTLITTPTGNKRIGDIKVGDIVISKNGNPTVITGVFPQGKRPVYEITITESGKSRQKTIIKAGAQHQWQVRTEEDRYKRRNGRVMTTLEMMNGTLHRGHDRHNNYSIDYIDPVQYIDKKVPIDPYLLGLLIGDGGLSSGTVQFSNTESDIVDKLKALIAVYGCELKDNRKDGCTYAIVGGSLRNELRKIGLLGRRSYEKFIPDNYLINSVDVRLALLQGLIDTDGFVDDNNASIEYSTTSEKLCEQVIWLVKSLGGKAEYKKRIGKYTTKDGQKIETRTNYRINIHFPKKGVVPVSSKKHLAKYAPKREYFYHFISDIQKTDEYVEMVCISVADESRQYCLDDNFILTHNTSSGLRLALMMGGRKPDGCIFTTGKGEGLVKSFFGGMNEVFDDENMYRRYLDVFPEAEKVGQNADELTIHLHRKRRFATFTCRPIDGSIVGNTEANVLLYIDDAVKNHEEARNRDRLEFLCEKVTDDVLGRRIEGTPIIIQGTKYSLYDPITMLQEKAEQANWRWKEVAIPALDPITDESNWDIVIEGKHVFTTQFYRNEREIVSPETWAAEFQQEPYEAKGRMFPEDKLNRFRELPIGVEPDAIMAVCDSADKGDDSCSMPIGYVYGREVYIVDVVFDNSPPEFTKPECANKLIEHNVKTITFESNSAGGYFGRDVMDLVDKAGGRCSARYKFNTANKITRMENASDNIIKYYYFLDKSKYQRGSQYDKFMKELTTMTRSGKVKHDDAPDSLALFENEMRSTPKTTVIMSSPI